MTAIAPQRGLPRTRRHDRARGFLGIEWMRLDWIMLGACAAIVTIGLVMVYSASRHRVDDEYYFVQRQAIALVVAVALFVLILKVDYRKFRDFSLLAYVATCVMLFAVLTPLGSNAKGAQAWFQVGAGFQFQPSELAKFGLIIALAGYVNEHRGDIDPWRLTVIVGLALVPVGLIQLQPDLGTNMVLLAIVVTMLAVAGVKGRYLLALVLLGLTGIFVVVQLGVLKEYQLDRLTAVANPNSDTSGAAYNQDQSKQSIGSGGVTGKGLFEGSQTQLGFVPEQHTDFIFTAVGEELGFVGAATLLMLFGVVVWRTWRTARIARDFYGTLVCAGVLGMLTFQVFENVGMCLGIMPVTGIPLPMMSYGGSSLIGTAACIALVANVHYRRFA
jgi:rod shape determining protein RodA